MHGTRRRKPRAQATHCTSAPGIREVEGGQTGLSSICPPVGPPLRHPDTCVTHTCTTHLTGGAARSQSRHTDGQRALRRCSTSSVVEETQSETAKRYGFTPGGRFW